MLHLLHSSQPPQISAAAAFLRLDDLFVSFDSNEKPVAAIRGVELELNEKEILGIVGESGSGKSVSCQAIMGLLPKTAKVRGKLTINNTVFDLSQTSKLSKLRGHTLSMIFQDPMSALDPLMSVKKHLIQRLRHHGAEGDLAYLAGDLLRRAGISDYKRVLQSYSHQLSGGQCQRVIIALALARDPKILIADEPTTALDVTIQAQILDLLDDLRNNAGLGVIFISHDLAVVSEICNRISVMYAGQIVESGKTETILHSPAHPYTEGLLASRPSISDDRGSLMAIPGNAITPDEVTEGCTFLPRCRYAKEICNFAPPYTQIAERRWVRCYFPLLKND